ncbi:eCIS core domain-containing protein [Allostreptomyces psammosilenae]|uniref:eCIS core domain-containing protein n=1 Tax=Allostreptomyces psammosilenae TaxID=1892865 RepID=A0A852ZQ52_9ACTN|nr:DUF4157 domain-containing protein [Allostreptomyces psammosilenae]NYI03875.1 hypothetical protein [Allostreptomyces psammosilenae]
MHEYEHGRDHAHEESGRPGRGSGPHAPAELSHLFKAAAAGRADVLGRAGLGSLQRQVGNSAVGSMLGEEEQQPRSPVLDVVSSGGGQPLDTETRSDMEARLGADFSDVRVHTDGAAHESAKAVGAHAYTVGNNVVFQRDKFDTSSTEGRTTLAHELTHVVQQRSGPVDGTEAPGGIRVSDPSDRFEREAVANAERAMAAPAPATDTAGAGAGTAGAAPVQRQGEDEEERPADVQGSFVQRTGAQAGQEEEEAPPA